MPRTWFGPYTVAVIRIGGHRTFTVIGKARRAERGSEKRGPDVITKDFRNRTGLRLKTQEKNFDIQRVL